MFSGAFSRLRKWRKAAAATLFLLLLSVSALASGEKVTEEQLAAVWAKFQQAQQVGFTVESMVELYQLDNAAAAVKKLVDTHQSNPQRSISPDQSAAMEGTRQSMNMEILKMLARVSGGRVEVLNFGKQNGIRSDKDQTIFAVDGKFFWSAYDMKVGFETLFKERFGIDLERMDMTVFDGDASIPDWRRQDISYREHIKKFKEGQAKLEQNSEAYREAGSYRAQVDRRSAEAGRVIIVEWNPDAAEYDIVENGRAADYSGQYRGWERHETARNAMGAVCENLQRFRHSNDFIDRMKYFNRTVGDGMIGLTEHWMHDYIFYMNDLRDDPEGAQKRKTMLDDIVRKNFPDASPAEQEVFRRVIEAAATIESDKMRNQTQSDSAYMRKFHDLIPEEQRRNLSPDELDQQAQKAFFEAQESIMKRGLVSVTKEKLRRDFTKEGLATAKRQYGEDAARKLRWETANQAKRVIHGLDDDPELVQKIIDGAPDETRKTLQTLHDAHQSRLARTTKKPTLDLARSDAEQARQEGPRIRDVIEQRVRADIEETGRHAEEVLIGIRTEAAERWEAFRADLDAGKYSDAEMTSRIRERVFNALGVEQREQYNELKGEMETRFELNARTMFNNLVDLGNADAVLNVIKAYQQSNGDVQAVGMAVIWELVSQIPGVSQVATLRQAYNDGDYVSLSWMFIAWQLPAAGQMKLAFDVAAGSMQVLYDHAMEPLKNDRFTQVYMGYLDKQPAGWSPFVPGVKERREAHQYSILKFVPGETFGQKRSNMYKYFVEQHLDPLLRRAGYDPTMEEYWDKVHEVAPAFFGRYVDQYFEARDDWINNTTAGLYDIGNQAELRLRLRNRLISDFRVGQMMQWQADAAREDFEQAVRDAQARAGRSIQRERELAIAEDFLEEQVGDQLEHRLEQLADEELPAEARVVAEAYPPVVLEGQEVRFAVKVIGADDADIATDSFDIELWRVGQSVLLDGVPSPSREQLEAIGDLDYLRPLLDSPDAADSKFNATRLNYEAVIKSKRTGAEVARNKLSVTLVGLELPDELDRQDTATVRMRVFKKDAAGESVREWQKTNADNSHPFQKREPFLMLRWHGYPEGKYYRFVGQIAGGIPPYEGKLDRGVIGWKTFHRSGGGDRGGNYFTISLPFDYGHTGTFSVTGELQAYEWAPMLEEQGTGTPVAVCPVNVEFTTAENTYEASASASINDAGQLSGSFETGRLQAGVRVFKIQAGEHTRYVLSGGQGYFTLANVEQAPSSITLSFPNFGKEITLTAPLTITEHKPRRPLDQKDIADTNKNIAQMRTDESKYPLMLARLYRSLASEYRWHDRETWLRSLESSRNYAQRGLQALRNPNWKGYTDNFSRGQSEQDKRALRKRIREQWEPELKGVITSTWSDMLEQAIYDQDLQSALQWYESWEQTLADHPQYRDPKNANDARAKYQDKLAELTFKVTGDVEAAYARWQQAEKYRRARDAAYGREHKPGRFMWVPAEGFGQPRPGTDQ